MEKVQKKCPKPLRGQRGKWVAAAFCLLALSVVVAWMMRRDAVETVVPQRHDTGGTLMQEAPGEICRISVTMRDRETWTMERNEEAPFQLAGEEQWLVDETISDRMTNALAFLEYDEIFTENSGEYENRLSEFGLEEPQVKVEWEMRDGRKHTIRIGDEVEPGESGTCFMLMENDARLYGVGIGTLQDLAVERTLLHTVPELPIRQVLLDGITLMNSEGEVLIRLELNGRITDQDAGVNWRMMEPFVYAVDEKMMKNLRESAGNLGLGGYVGEVTEERLEACGLISPRMVLSFHMAAGSTGTVTESGVYDVTDWEEETVKLLIGEPYNEMMDYVQYEDAVYSMAAFTLSPFLEINPMDLAARYPVLTPLDSLISLTVEKMGQENTEYEIVREEGQNTRCLKNGREIAWETFEAAYNRLLVVTVSGMLPKDAKWGKAHTKYTFHSVNGGTHIVFLSDFDGMHDAVTLDGETLFYLIRGGMTELP